MDLLSNIESVGYELSGEAGLIRVNVSGTEPAIRGRTLNSVQQYRCDFEMT